MNSKDETTTIIKRRRGRPRKNNNNEKKLTNKTVKQKAKLKSKKYSLLESNQKSTIQKFTESVVVHLPINIEHFQKKDIFFDHEFLNYDIQIQEPLPYDPKSNNNDNIYEDIGNIKKPEKSEPVEEDKKEYNIHNKDEYINKKVKQILVQFNDSNKVKQWPNSTDIKCWWCCHNFDNTPCGIPTKYDVENETFFVYGCFCSFNCALSYNFNTNIDKKWERAGFIKLLYNKTFNTNDDLDYAPNKECLKEYGGYMTIEEFRNNTEKIKYNINYPPMLSIIPQIEEIKIIKETNREHDFKEKLNKVSEKMKIKNRIKNKKSLSIFLKAKQLNKEQTN